MRIDGAERLPSRFVVKSADICTNRSFSRGDLDALAQLEDLEVLLLRHVLIPNADLGPLAKLTRLSTLDLSFTQITDEALAQLEPIQCLNHLNVSGTDIADSGLKHLLELERLEELDVSSTGVSDEGVKYLGQLPRLKSLSLFDTQITDVALTHLHNMTGLQQLRLDSTLVTEEGVQALQTQLPECKVELTVRRPIDLLSLIDANRDIIEGQWNFEADALASSNERFARIQIPYSPPNAYFLDVVAQRQARDHGACIGFVIGGRQLTVLMDDWPDLGGITALEAVDGRPGAYNETALQTKVFTSSEPVQLRIAVRPPSISVVADDRQLINWSGDIQRLTVHPNWVVPDDRVLFVGSREGSFKFTKIELIPIAGKGKVVTDLRTRRNE
jgi:hypothetical protein